jgi:23S rRNA pseudouridine1911/1915/1917 synthase
MGAGRISHQGKPVERRSRLEEGAVLSVDWPNETTLGLVPQELGLEVLYEDDAVRVVNKQPDMVVHPGEGTPDGTVVNGLLALEPELAALDDGSLRPGIVHRLDKGTSGVLITARTGDALCALQQAFAHRQVGKIYLALTRDRPRSESPLVGDIGRHPVHRQRMAVVAEGKAAVTHYRLLTATPEGHLWAIRIETGRTHQIRVHFASDGAPVLGDSTYARRKLASMAPRQMLHAWQLNLPHPLTGEPLVCKAPVPRDFVEVAEGLGIDLDVLLSPEAGRVD